MAEIDYRLLFILIIACYGVGIGVGAIIFYAFKEGWYRPRREGWFGKEARYRLTPKGEAELKKGNQ